MENNTARMVFMIGGVIVTGLAIIGIVKYWPEVQQILTNLIGSRNVKM